MSKIYILISLSLIVAFVGRKYEYAEVQRPNIIVFLVDDMGLMDSFVPFLTDDNGGGRKEALNHFYHTPSMEKLAEKGIRFSKTQHWSKS